jgi:DNA polymerase (family X)
LTAREAAAALAEIAVLLEVVGGNPFRARAFRSAARALETSGADLPALAAGGRLRTLRGVGEGIAGVLEELLSTGSSRMLEELRAGTPAGVYDLMRVRGLGASRIRRLFAELGIDSLETLQSAAAAGRIAPLPGFGPATERRILEGVEFARSLRGLRRLFQAVEAASALLELVESLPGVTKVRAAGELRRRLEVVGSLDLVAAGDDPRSVHRGFAAAMGAEPNEAGVHTALADGLAVSLRCVTPDRFAGVLLHATGSPDHLDALGRRAAERGLRLAEDGLHAGGERLETPDEEAVYGALGLAWIPPELREGWGEVEAAAEGRLPELVEAGDLRGTFHCHTTDSDGRASLEEMASAARERGWSYLGIADHSRAASYAGGMTPDAVRAQQARITRWNREHGGRGKERFRLLSGTEADILPDGSLDYDDALLGSFDFVVGSVHSGFAMPEREMTDRIVRAVENPRLTMLGHPTGRILLRRPGYGVDLDAVLDAAAHHGVAVEINADPNRLDLDWRGARSAAERGVPIVVNPDAHSVPALGNVAWGVGIARKGWLTRGAVLNTRELDRLEEWIAERKQEGAP